MEAHHLVPELEGEPSPTMLAAFAAVDVSDGSSAPRRGRKAAVSWPTQVVASEVSSKLDGNSVRAFHADLWFSADDFKLARLEMQRDRLLAPDAPHVRPFSSRPHVGHKRPSTEGGEHIAGAPSNAKRGATSPPSLSIAGLCLESGMCVGPTVSSTVSHRRYSRFSNEETSSAAAFCRYRASTSTAPSWLPGAAESASAAATSAPDPLRDATDALLSASASGSDAAPTASAQPGVAPTQQPPSPTASLCLQRASIAGPLSSSHLGPSVASSSYLGPSVPSSCPHSASAQPASQAPARTARNPHGLTMSQRVAALQIGAPATYVHAHM
jgi:hypothetical protein